MRWSSWPIVDWAIGTKPLLDTASRAIRSLTAPGFTISGHESHIRKALVDHRPVSPAFGFRFDTADRSIVISGDTTPTQSLIELAKGADVLVHDAFFKPAIDRMVARAPNAPALRQSILSHTRALRMRAAWPGRCG